MDKLSRIEEFLNYGGNELFSQLMSLSTDRVDGVGRLTELLEAYSDSCRRIRGRSAAYRFMLRKALKRGWLGRGSKDLKSHRLTAAERENILKSLSEYISSSGKKAQIARNVLCYAIAAAVVIAVIFTSLQYFCSEEFKRMAGSIPQTVTVSQTATDRS